jgi:DHA1 family multidrug resistance protein-like MFS transporter
MTSSSISWRRNLYIIVAVEFAVLLAYGFTSPFMPFFIQDLGTFTDSQAAFWSGVTTTVFGLTMFLSGPIWGIIADRAGRKPMVLRAVFGVAILSVATGLAPNVYWVIACRAAQGLFSGTMAAASAMISANTPRDKIPYAMGLLTMAMFAGNTLGPFLGGVIAAAVGYQNCFFFIAVVYLMGGMAVLFFTREDFVPEIKRWGTTLRSLGRLASSRQIMPLLIVLCVISIGPSVMTPVLPLIIKEMGNVADVAFTSGLAFSLMGVVSTMSSLVASRIASGNVSLKKMMVWCSLFTGLLYLPPMFAYTLVPFIALMALRGTFNGGINIASSSLIALTVKENEQGMAYGLQQSAQFLGSGIGPMLGGTLAAVVGLRSVFPVSAGLYIVAGLLVFLLLPELKRDKLS